MIRIVSVEQIREIEAVADRASLSYATMMQNAGRAAAERAKIILAGLSGAPKVTVLVGPGNNGGDALVVSKLLAQETQAQVRVYLTKPRANDDPLMSGILAANIFVAHAAEDLNFQVLINLIVESNMVIDGLFGIGLRLPIKDEPANLLHALEIALHKYKTINAASRAFLETPAEPHPPAARPPFIFALDCPSGLNCDTGEIDQHSLHADETITFIAPKPGLLKFPGAAAVGKLTVASIGVPPNISMHSQSDAYIVTADDIREKLPPRNSNSNKGTYGKLLIVGGSAQYTGAPTLAAHAAYRAGAGLVTVAVPASILPDIRGTLLEATWVGLREKDGALDQNASTEVTIQSANFDSLLIGPGLSRAAGDFITFFLNEAANLKNLVIDADGLNLMSEIENWWTYLPGDTILTPHPGEMGRLCSLTTAEVQSRRWELAAAKAAAWNTIIVLKGAHTVIAFPNGQTAILPFKTSALATAGTGDVLAGVIAGLLAQGVMPFDAAQIGGYLHGLAGVKVAETIGERASTAHDISKALSTAWCAIEGGHNA
ncbi:MAG: NAD(P)H-hydrate dehydratase [Anaerolineae bacterium]|nr:NAD(P)H-hydrate dehydratase [Anaerolineae bacterium]